MASNSQDETCARAALYKPSAAGGIQSHTFAYILTNLARVRVEKT